MDNEPINLLLAGYNRLFREGMRLLLGTRFNILKEAGSFDLALKYMQTNEVDVHLLIGDPGPNPSPELTTVSTITQQFPRTKVIVLTERTTQFLSDTVLNSGAVGFLSGDISVAALLYSVEIVLLGERIVPTVLPSALASGSHTSSSDTGHEISMRANPLSGREDQILQCLVDGLSNKLIARNLGVTESTVKVHLKALLRKLRVQNRTQAAVWALGEGHRRNEISYVRSQEPTGRHLDREDHQDIPDHQGVGTVQPHQLNGCPTAPANQLWPIEKNRT